MGRAVGVGGVFLKANDPAKLSAWYAEHLGIPSQGGGTLGFDGPDAMGMTVFSHFPENTKYFGEGSQQAMINFRVDNMDELLAQLAAAEVRIDPDRQDHEYGKFAWFWDPEGNRVELWQAPAEEGSK
jgi:catechol 2,3-dioxygenase-like lactoylglutathione lyase family enzyme